MLGVLITAFGIVYARAWRPTTPLHTMTMNQKDRLAIAALARDRKDGRKEGAAQEEEDAAMAGF